MIDRLVRCALVTGLCVIPHSVGKTQPPPEGDFEATFEIPADEVPFWESARAFLDAYAERDAAAIGELFTEDAEFRDEFGERTVGRDAIVALYEDVFASAPEVVLQAIDIERIRYVRPTVVLEEGWVSARDAADGPVSTSRYMAVHVKEDDDLWRINTLRTYPHDAHGKSVYLDQLAWLVGEWVNEGTNARVETTCRWSDDGNYLLRRYELETSEGKALSGVQRIGWDPLRRQVRSWTFDSEGGFLKGLWSRNDDRWIVTSQGTTSDGRPIQVTATYDIVDPERIIWDITSLVIGSEVMPGRESVVLMRAAPAPRTDE